MKWGVAVGKAIWALFVDDASFVALAIAWLALMKLLVRVGLALELGRGAAVLRARRDPGARRLA